MIPKEAFHYTKSSTLKKIISGQALKMGRLKYTNDPKESKEHFFDSFLSSSNLEWETSDKYKKLYQMATPIKLNEWKVLCVSKNHPEIESGKKDRYHYPFFSGSCRPRMWAHYADNHSGVCLKFNGDKLDAQIRKKSDEKCHVYCGDVEYIDHKFIDSTSPDVNIDEIFTLEDIQLKDWLRKYFKENYKEILLKKSKDWETESEFRWLIHSEEDVDVFIPISDVLEEITVGSDFPEAEYPMLFKFCKDLNIRVFKMVWNNGIPARKILSPLVYEKKELSKLEQDGNFENNLIYFECPTMKELYDIMKNWENENHRHFISINIQQDKGGNFCCIASISPANSEKRITHTEYEEAMIRFERKALRIIVKERNIGAIIQFVDPVIPAKKVLAIQKRLTECTTATEIRAVFEEFLAKLEVY